MKYSIEVSEQAVADLRGIFLYIFEQLQMPESAARIVSNIRNRIESLSFMPRRYGKYTDSNGEDIGVHIAPVRNYRIFYKIYENGRIVSVVRILYKRRNIKEIF